MANIQDGLLYTYKGDNDYCIYNDRLVKIIRGYGIRELEDVKTGERFYAKFTTLFKPLTEEDKLRLL